MSEIRGKVAGTLAIVFAATMATAQSPRKSVSAILYPLGTVYVNGVSVTGPTAVYRDDKITIGSSSSATLTDPVSGKSVGIGSGAARIVDGSATPTSDSHFSCQPFNPKPHKCCHSSPDPSDTECSDTDAIAPQDLDSCAQAKENPHS